MDLSFLDAFSSELSDDSGYAGENVGDLLHESGDLLCLPHQMIDDEYSFGDCGFSESCSDLSLIDCKVDDFLRDYCPSKLEEALSACVTTSTQSSNNDVGYSCNIFIPSLEYLHPTPSCPSQVDYRLEETVSLCHQLQHEFQQPFLHATQEMKPHETYIELIVRAILSTPQMKMNLPEIYSWITSNYSYFLTAPKTWKNAVRHNLSMNEFFRKSGRAGNGRGSFWSIHPACTAAFQIGDYRRREARHRVMVADEEAKRQQFRKSMMMSTSFNKSQPKDFTPSSYSAPEHFLPMTSTPFRSQDAQYIAYQRC